jgi:hypothetical protein
MNDKYEKTVDFINYAIQNDPKTQVYYLFINSKNPISIK